MAPSPGPVTTPVSVALQAGVASPVVWSHSRSVLPPLSRTLSNASRNASRLVGPGPMSRAKSTQATLPPLKNSSWSLNGTRPSCAPSGAALAASASRTRRRSG